MTIPGLEVGSIFHEIKESLVDTIGKPWCLREDKNGSYACMEDGQSVCLKWKPGTLWTFLSPINGFPLTRNTMSSFSLRSHSKGLREKILLAPFGLSGRASKWRQGFWCFLWWGGKQVGNRRVISPQKNGNSLEPEINTMDMSCSYVKSNAIKRYVLTS